MIDEEEGKKKSLGKKMVKKMIISSIVSVLIPVLLAAMFFAILQAIIDIIVAVVKAILTAIANFFSDPIGFVQQQWANFSNWLDRTFGVGDEFNPDEYEEARANFDASIVISQDEFNLMVHGSSGDDGDEGNKVGLEDAVDRDAEGVGLDDFFLKKMLLAYYRGLYFSDTNVLIELTEEEASTVADDGSFAITSIFSESDYTNDEIKPFYIIMGDKDKGIGEDDKIYLKARGSIHVTLEGTDTPVIYYPEETMKMIFKDEYLAALDNGYENYANSVLDYLDKCYTYSETGIKMYGKTTDYTLDYIEYANDGWPEILNSSNYDTSLGLVNIEYHEKVAQFATPLEFMVNLMNITGSKEFITSFITMVGNTNHVDMDLNDITYTEITEETQGSVRDITVTGTHNDTGAEKEITDTSDVIMKKIKYHKESKFDLVMTEAVTWYGSITQSNEEKTTTTYTSIDETGAEVDIGDETSGIAVPQEDENNEYSSDTNPNIFRNLELKYPITETFPIEVLVGDAADEDASKYLSYTKRIYSGKNLNVFSELGEYVEYKNLGVSGGTEEGCLTKQFNFVKRKETDYENYSFDKMTIEDTTRTMTTTKKVINKTYETTVGTAQDNTDLFLALLSGEDSTYNVNNTSSEVFVPKSEGGKIVTYEDLYDSNKETTKELYDGSFFTSKMGVVGAGEILENSAEMLFDLLEKSPNTQGLTDIMRYIMYRYSGNDYGVTEFAFELYDPLSFTAQASTGTSVLVEYLHALAGAENPPENADGTKYIIYDDGSGNPMVGYGIDIIGGGYQSLFEGAGYSIEIGAEVDKEFVDQLEEDEVNDIVEEVKEKTRSLDLKEYQIHALVARVKDCGMTEAFGIKNGKTFVQAYNEYWNPETDDLFELKEGDADFAHALYTDYLNKPTDTEGGSSQRKSEWTLFQTGYYKEIDRWYPDGAAIIEMCIEVMNDMLAHNVRYKSNDSEIIYQDIERASNFNRPNPKVCCSTYAAIVLYRAGIFTPEVMNTGDYNSPEKLNTMFTNAGLETVRPEEAQPGDICNFTVSVTGDRSFRHTFIYGGGNEIWDQQSGAIGADGSPPARGSMSLWTYYVNNAGDLKIWRMP